MLVYLGSDILEIRPQQVINSEKLIQHPYLKLMDTIPSKEKPKKKYKPRKTINDGNNRQSDN